MNKYKNIIKVSSLFIGFLLIYTLLITFISYFDLLKGNIINIINFIVVAILMFISGFKLASVTKSKGYMAGIIMGLVNMAILLIISVILRSDLSLDILLFFLILLLSSTIGGMAGINFNNTLKE